MNKKIYKIETVVNFSDISKFLKSNAIQKVNLIQEIKCKLEYEPKKDYYKLVRETFKRYNRSKDLTVFSDLEMKISDPLRKNHFLILMKGYLNFLKKNEGEIFLPSGIRIDMDSIELRIKADVGILSKENKMLFVKFYFKKEPLTIQDNTLGIYLLKREYESQYGKDVECGILDIRRNKLYLSSKDPRLEIILNSELALFVKMLKAA